MTGPLYRLAGDNFTPLQRTPWAGFGIAQFKGLGTEKQRPRIGESWEFSLGPEFPSGLIGDSKAEAATLAELAQKCPDLFQQSGKALDYYILVKLLEASQPLSLQVHPEDNDSALSAGECGKPESWFVIDHQPGAGIYLGFREGVEKSALQDALKRGDGDGVAAMFQFVPVRKGDYFEIRPGTPHAIGAGVLLLEPQRVLPGRNGKTYRLWDWGRRYNEKGELDEHGSTRTLHIEPALALIDPGQQAGPAFVRSLRRGPQTVDLGPELQANIYGDNPYYRTIILESASIRPHDSQSHAVAAEPISLRIDGGYGAVTGLQGVFNVDSFVLRPGESALWPVGRAASVALSPGGKIAVVAPVGANLVRV